MCVLGLAGTALAQDEDDPPGRVMRLQYMAGQVSLQPGGVDDWSDAYLNRPLTTADRLWVDEGGRAELTMGTAVARLGSMTAAAITNLDDRTAQIELDQGSMVLSVRQLDSGEIVEVDTPNFAFTVESPGEYRFDVYPDRDESLVLVRRGFGEASGNGNSVPVQAGQQFRFWEGQSLAYENRRAARPDGFENWCNGREQHELASISLRYVAPGTIGYSDLDEYGDWRTEGEYGAVWVPRVASDWAPYRMGHWAWIEPWGWTWVDDAPWGFAPFHYGRWVTVHGRWGWVPGPVAVRPVYAPALVAWVGNVSIGVGSGGVGVGWFPLGWRDPFIPAYHVSPRYARQVNVSNTRVVNVTVINNYYNTTNVNIRNTTINNIRYENREVRGAMTGVPRGEFAAGRPVRDHGVVIKPGQVRPGAVMAAAEVPPSRTAVFGGRGPAQPPRGLVMPRQVVAKTPPPAPPVNFDRQRNLLERNRGIPLEPQQRGNLRDNQRDNQMTPARPGLGRPTVVSAGQPTQPSAPPLHNNIRPGQPPRGTFNAPQQPQSPAQPPANQPGNRPDNWMNDRGDRPGNQTGNQNWPSRQPNQGQQPGSMQPAQPGQTPSQSGVSPTQTQRPTQPLRLEDRPQIRPAPVQNRNLPVPQAPTPATGTPANRDASQENRAVTPTNNGRPQMPPPQENRQGKPRTWDNWDSAPRQTPPATRPTQTQPQPQPNRPAAEPQSNRAVPQTPQQQSARPPQTQSQPAPRPAPAQPQASRPAPAPQKPVKQNQVPPKDEKKDNPNNQDKRNDR